MALVIDSRGIGIFDIVLLVAYPEFVSIGVNSWLILSFSFKSAGGSGQKDRSLKISLFVRA